MDTTKSLAPLSPPPSPPVRLPVIGARAGVTAEWAPGRRTELKDPEPIERFCIAELVPLGGGTFRVVPRVTSIWLPMTETWLARLGASISENTMRRLGAAGFIRTRQPSPNRHEFNLVSWVEHCAAVESDPEFWDREVTTPAGKRTNRRRYQEAL